MGYDCLCRRRTGSNSFLESVTIIIAIANVILVLLADIGIDLYKLKKGKAIIHWHKPIFRGVLLLPAIILFSKEIEGSMVFCLALPAAMIFFFYWIFFDGGFNIFRNYPWFSTGSEDPDDAILDNLQQNHEWTKVAKIIIATGLITYYTILCYQN